MKFMTRAQDRQQLIQLDYKKKMKTTLLKTDLKPDQTGHSSQAGWLIWREIEECENAKKRLQKPQHPGFPRGPPPWY